MENSEITVENYKVFHIKGLTTKESPRSFCMWKKDVETVEKLSVKDVYIEIFSSIGNPTPKPFGPFFI